MPFDAAGAPPPTVKRHVSGRYAVVMRERPKDVGTDIAAMTGRPTSGICRSAPTSADVVVGKGQPSDIVALTAPFLALEAGGVHPAAC